MVDVRVEKERMVVVIDPDESRMIRNKGQVFNRHWYQKGVKEVEAGVLVTSMREGVDIPLNTIRNSLNTLDEKAWYARVDSFLGGLLSQFYLVQRNIIYPPYMQPNNFVYNPSTNRVLSFYRKDKGLQHINKEFHKEVYKLIAYMFTNVEDDNYGELQIEEIEAEMLPYRYEYFYQLLEYGNVETMVKQLVSEREQENLNTYGSLIPNAKRARVEDVKIVVDWESEKYQGYQKADKEFTEKLTQNGGNTEEELEKYYSLGLEDELPVNKVRNNREEFIGVTDKEVKELENKVQTKRVATPSNRKKVVEPKMYVSAKRKKNKRYYQILEFVVVTIIVIAIVVYIYGKIGG